MNNGDRILWSIASLSAPTSPFIIRFFFFRSESFIIRLDKHVLLNFLEAKETDAKTTSREERDTHILLNFLEAKETDAKTSREERERERERLQRSKTKSQLPQCPYINMQGLRAIAIPTSETAENEAKLTQTVFFVLSQWKPPVYVFAWSSTECVQANVRQTSEIKQNDQQIDHDKVNMWKYVFSSSSEVWRLRWIRSLQACAVELIMLDESKE